MEKLLLPCILLFSFLYIFFQRWVYRDKDDKGPKLTGRATVKSHRVEQGRFHGKAPGKWLFIVTFTLSDGEDLDLYTFETEFRALKDGTAGQLTWQGDQLRSFDGD